ncbi:MAG: CapA family protein, partial [Ignavibacteriae bacterium]|nr:CapA family protein [Ignavibacteriota bacterium]
RVDSYQKKITKKTVSYGADIILASHPHIVQPFERFKTNNGKLDSGFVTYSQGNFLSNQRWRYSDGAMIFNFNITKNIFTDSVYITGVNYLPIWVFRGKTEKGKEYKILPSEYYNEPEKFDFLTTADVDSMKRSYFDTVELFTAKSAYPKIDTLRL